MSFGKKYPLNSRKTKFCQRRCSYQTLSCDCWMIALKSLKLTRKYWGLSKTSQSKTGLKLSNSKLWSSLDSYPLTQPDHNTWVRAVFPHPTVLSTVRPMTHGSTQPSTCSSSKTKPRTAHVSFYSWQTHASDAWPKKSCQKPERIWRKVMPLSQQSLRRKQKWCLGSMITSRKWFGQKQSRLRPCYEWSRN